MAAIDPVRLEVFKHLFASAAEEMGVLLKRASYSPNIKERRDFSCAVFDGRGRMVAQAAHIPVHLGAMPLSVLAAIERFQGDGGNGSADAEGLQPGDVIVLNDPFHGGTHLPDITLVSPVFDASPEAGRAAQLSPAGFVASRAHHADVGGMTAGSMPVAQEIFQEGLIIPPVKLVAGGRLRQDLWDLILANVRTPGERAGDLRAQLAANQRGTLRMQELAQKYGSRALQANMQALLEYTERMTRRLLAEIPDGTYVYTDYLDGDGISDGPVKISAAITVQGDRARVDFSGSAPQCAGSVNAVYAITLSAVYYVFRCLIGLDVPNNSGCLAPIEVIAPRGSVVNAEPPAAVAGGNVETSQRIVDVLLGALAQALPGKVPAASQGTMNNVTIGGWDSARRAPFTYYETIGGGMGARPWGDGPSAVHSHMTNTLNTPVEALEYSYPLRVLRYEIRRGSGGAGRFRGGDGTIREVQLLVSARVTLLSERRLRSPYGAEGGQPGAPGMNSFVRQGQEQELPGKVSLVLEAGDILAIHTPGGGGHGRPGGAAGEPGEQEDSFPVAPGR